MGTSSSNIRRKIIKLEKALKLQLITVYQKQILLTEDGRNFIKFCKRVVDAGEQGYLYVEDLKRHPQGDLSVLINSESLFNFIKNKAVLFTNKYPNINIELIYKEQNSFAQERPNDLLLTTHSKYKYPNACTEKIGNYNKEKVYATYKKHKYPTIRLINFLLFVKEILKDHKN